MLDDIFIRTRMIIGDEGLEQLQNKTVAIFGIGGVGSFAVEALCRAGVGRLILIDFDTIAPSNLNRQIHGTQSTIGQLKVEAMKERILSINPKCDVIALPILYDHETAADVFKYEIHYVIDAIDMVTSKIHLIETCCSSDIPIVSSMGTGNKLDPTKFELSDIYKTSVCPLAKVMRRELKARGIKKLTVVYSKEEVKKPIALEGNPDNPRKQIPGSLSFVPPVAGMILASKVIRDFIGQ